MLIKLLYPSPSRSPDHALGDQAGALEAIGEAERLVPSTVVDIFFPVAVQRARLLLAQGKVDQALRLFRWHLEEAQAQRRRGSEIEILMLQALALWERDAKERAGSTLTRALTLAEPEGYVRTFVDEVPQMASLLSEVLMVHQSRHLVRPDRPSAHYLRKLLTALEQAALSSMPPTAELPEPLTERELEVLILIEAGKSNRRIAQELFVTTGTVKTHIRSIYRKLDAHSRTQALVRARELNLLWHTQREQEDPSILLVFTRGISTPLIPLLGDSSTPVIAVSS
jgi:ATP/maltotriose-dependent transcriptional regulator MalT